MFQFLEYRKTVQKRFLQLKELDKEIIERVEELDYYEKLLEIIKKKVKDVEDKYEELFSYDDLKEQLEILKKMIKDKKDILAKIDLQIEVGEEVISIEERRRKLREEMEVLKSLKEKAYDPKDLILVAYNVPNINDIAIGVFEFVEKARYSGDSVGSVYKSLGEGRRIGFTSDFSEGLVSNIPEFNALPKRFITFEEACIAIGSDLYLRNRVTSTEVNEVLNMFKTGFYIVGKSDISNEEFIEMLKEGKKVLGSKPLVRLLEKGDTN